jgi:glyoxylase-like metal-dependent hydrolase (beta-lactamase superfamily II)
MKKLDPTGPSEQISPRCRRIPLPDPFVPGVTSVFVLDSETGAPPWLLDSGADMPESEAKLRAGLEPLAVTPETASGVVLSHTHLDHAGGLLRWQPARLLVHQNAAKEMRNLRPSSSRGRTALRLMGLPADLVRELAPEREPVGGTPFARTRVSDSVSGPDGSIPDSGGWWWILAEGHAPGHLMVFHPEDRVLLAADQFLYRWKTPIRISDPEEDSFGLYMDSLDRALGLDPLIVCSSHTGAVQPAIPFLEDRRGVLLRQLDRTLEAVRNGSATTWEVVTDGVDRVPRGGLLILLLRERLAMLRHLAAGGAVVRRLQDGVERFSPA